MPNSRGSKEDRASAIGSPPFAIWNLTSGIGHRRRESPMESFQGKRVAVLAEKFYEDLELWYPVLRLREAGCDVTIVGPKAGETYTSKHGYPARADVSAGDVRAG